MSVHALKQARYLEWLRAQGIAYGFDAEVAGKAQAMTAGVRNDTPPLEKWHRIVPTIRVAELLRERFGATTVQSAYRTLSYNHAVGGARESQHAQNTALDLSCASGTPAEWATFLRGLRDAGRFTGGIGTYATFVHVDTRGTVADWTG